MKTQIITLAAHDDLISIRDRMSWAKAPRILLVWPSRAQVTLQPLDLRILQQHARELGAEMGVVARGEGTRRDARAFGIPVFRSAVEAQRLPWQSHTRRARRGAGTIRARLTRIRELQLWAQPSAAKWTSGSAARLSSFTLAVLSVFVIGSLFVPRATIILTPETREQRSVLTADVRAGEGETLSLGGLPAQMATTIVSGARTMPVLTRSELATTKAIGVARFQNLTAVPLFVPAETVVVSLEPGLVRFVTLQDAQLDAESHSTVDVPIEAVEAGEDGNVAAASIQATEGSLSASVSVTNPDSTVGGASDAQSVPSEVDRNQLKADLQQTLRTEAQSAIESDLQEGDILLPDTLQLVSIEREEFDPPAGQLANVLSLTLEITYQARYIRGIDLRGLSLVALDAEVPPGYVAKEDTLRMQLNQIAATSGQVIQLQIDLQRTLNRRIDMGRANGLVRGRAPARASALLAQQLPLAEPPEIQLTPSWWPWLPLIPFRIELVTSCGEQGSARPSC